MIYGRSGYRVYETQPQDVILGNAWNNNGFVHYSSDDSDSDVEGADL